MDDMIILESVSRRQQLCTDRNAKVLDQISPLKMLGSSYTAAQYIADFYQVNINTLQQVIKRHRDELISDGYKILSKKDLENVHHVHFKIPNRGLAVFTRRAVLRIGMLLRDSVVAKLVRSYLLNSEERVAFVPESRQTLLAMANQLDEHATQLIRNVSQLSDHAGQLQSQARMIKAVVDGIYMNRDYIKELKENIKSNKSRIVALEDMMFRETVDNKKYITAEQINILRKKVKDRGRPSAIWAKFRSHFGIKRYTFLPKDKFDHALKWIEGEKW